MCLYFKCRFRLSYGNLYICLDKTGGIKLHFSNVLVKFCTAAEEIHNISTRARPVRYLSQRKG